MVRYTVAFKSDGTTKKVTVGEAQFKKGRLRCQDQRNNDSVTVALIPADSVEYVLEESTEVTDAAGDGND